MPAEEEVRYNIYVVQLHEHVGMLASVRRRNPQRDASKPCVYIGLTWLPLDAEFDYRGGGWPVSKWGLRLMPELYKHLRPMTFERAVQSARKLAEELRSKGYSVSNGISERTQSYLSSRFPLNGAGSASRNSSLAQRDNLNQRGSPR